MRDKEELGTKKDLERSNNFEQIWLNEISSNQPLLSKRSKLETLNRFSFNRYKGYSLNVV